MPQEEILIKQGIALQEDLTSINAAIDSGFNLSGDAVVGNVLADKTFYKDDVRAKLTGTMVNKVGSATVITPSTADQTIAAGYYGGATEDGKVLGSEFLVAGNIKEGITIFGVLGTYTGA